MDNLIRFRVSSEDRKLFEATAKAAGLKLSEWLRAVARSAAGEPPQVAASDVDPPKPRPGGVEVVEASRHLTPAEKLVLSAAQRKSVKPAPLNKRVIPKPAWKVSR